MTAKEFYNKHVNKVIDMDYSPKGDIYQCVDLFKAFTKENYNTPDYTTGNGWASGLWIYRKEKPYYKYFIDGNKNNLQNGDWCVWGKCKACPDSHVAMYYNGKFFGQNQNGIKKATLVNISKDGIIGVLRPKMYVKQEKVDQILHVGSKVQVTGTYKVKDINVKENTAKINIAGKDYWISSVPLKEV